MLTKGYIGRSGILDMSPRKLLKGYTATKETIHIYPLKKEILKACQKNANGYRRPGLN
jgi:hypothetical protein